MSLPIKCCAFDCFGTLFDMTPVPKSDIAAYVHHVQRADFSPYTFPKSWYDLKAHPDVSAGILEIQSSGILCVALSNGSKELIEHLAIMNILAFDRVIDLVAHKVYKPHVDAYKTVHKETGVKPHETLMVTANPLFGDLEGAAAIGMRSQVIRHGYPNTVLELADVVLGRT
jgi:2-haloalkanoic acid dehalogenase type II